MYFFWQSPQKIKRNNFEVNEELGRKSMRKTKEQKAKEETRGR